jgi:hypothetical protein
MRMIISTQKILPILIPAIAAALRVLLETDGCDVGDTSALIVVIVLEVVERASVNNVVESSRVEAAGTNDDAIEDTPDTSVVVTVADRTTIVVAAAVMAGVTVAPGVLMLRVIAADSHRLWANWRPPEEYFSYLVNYEVGVLIDILAMSAGEHSAARAASSDSRKDESSQIHAISVMSQLVDPRAEPTGSS